MTSLTLLAVLRSVVSVVAVVKVRPVMAGASVCISISSLPSPLPSAWRSDEAEETELDFGAGPSPFWFCGRLLQDGCDFILAFSYGGGASPSSLSPSSGRGRRRCSEPAQYHRLPTAPSV